MDALIIKTLPLNLPNFIGRESLDKPYLAAGVLRFQRNHPILQEFLYHMKFQFDGYDWGANGPKLVTKVMKQFCSEADLDKMTPETCLGITVFEPKVFYLVPWKAQYTIFS